jgi:hypothetical protein
MMKSIFPALLATSLLIVATETFALSIDPPCPSHQTTAKLNPALALKLAKQAGMELSSPPRIWNNSQAEVNVWSSIPDVATPYEYFNCGIVPINADPNFCMTTATLIPIVAAHPQGGYTVTLQVNFGDTQLPSLHAWNFWVKDVQTVEFIGETGVPLLVSRQ